MLLDDANRFVDNMLIKMRAKYMDRCIPLIFFVAIFGLTSHANGQAAILDGITEDEYKFLSEVGCSTDSRLMSVYESETGTMQISLKKQPPFMAQVRAYYAEAKLPDASKELLKDFNSKNKQSYRLEKKLTGCNYALITDEEKSAISKTTDYWKEFEIRYPNSGGMWKISRIAFSVDKKQALFFKETICGGLCASSGFHFFVNEDGKWIEKAKAVKWFS